MVTRKVVRLGQEAFVLSPDGEVVRTMVAKLEREGYQFLDGSSYHRPHWFSFQVAASIASERIETRETVLRKELRALARKRRMFEAQDYRDSIMNAPYRVVDLRDPLTFVVLRRTRKLKKVVIPKTYLRPGHMAYVVITPMTRSGSEAYRPYNHFVLETEVTSVCFSPGGQAHYTFSTPFIVEESFPSREAATARLESFSEPGTKEPVPFVSNEREKEEIAKLPDDIPF